MKTFSFGFESATLQNSQLQVFYGPLPPLILRAYEIDLSMQNMGYSGFLGIGAAPTSQVLFYASFSPILPSGWVGGQVFAPFKGLQLGGTNPTGLGGSPLVDGTFAASILKEVPTNFVNKSLVLSGLDIAVPANSYLVLQAAHSGVVVDFEAQGVLYYDNMAA